MERMLTKRYLKLARVYSNEMADLHPLQALIKILRVQFKALVTHSFTLHGYGPQEAFDDPLKALKTLKSRINSINRSSC